MNIRNRSRIAIAIVAGLITTFTVFAVFSPAMPNILPSFASLAGGLVAGLIIKKRGFVCGGLVSAIVFFVLIYSLIEIAYTYSGGKYVLPNVLPLLPNIVAIPLGALGGYLGENLSSKILA